MLHTVSRRALHLRRWKKWIAALGVLLAPLAAFGGSVAFDTERLRIVVTTLAEGLEHPWGLVFLPDGRTLVTERPGRLRIVRPDGHVSSPLAGVPQVAAVGQGGLLDVVLAPDFIQSGHIYLSYAEPAPAGNRTSVARARLTPRALTDVKVIFRQVPAVDSPAHFGSRLVFARDGTLFVTLGERAASHFAVRAQDLETHFGKIVRITPGGKAPADNPFLAVPGARPEIWSYGHRNVQGAALHPRSGELWIVEHGPKGGDELNVARAGANYGWPLVTYGVAYSGQRIGVGSERAGMSRPLKYWVPSIGTSAMAFYTGPRKEWAGNAFVAGLHGVLVRLELEGERVVHEERLLSELKERIRNVLQGPDGCLYVLTDSQAGRLLRIAPE